MKVRSAVAVALSVLYQSSTTSAKSSLGPRNCVSITRSSAGSCVITTDCEGIDLATTEFAFDCAGSDGVVRHSFGKGGFDANEEFDSEVKCDRCSAPEDAAASAAPSKAAVPPPAPVTKSRSKPVIKAVKTEVPVVQAFVKAKTRHAVKAQATAEAKAQFWPFDVPKEPKPEVTRYGPSGCVSTWKSEENHCIINTDCKGNDISKYEFGLVCVDKTGAPVRHLFGRDSFDNAETFDTLIKCDKCLGLEDIPDAVALNGEVQTISKDIANLKDVMKNISINVEMLNEEVFKKAAAAPAAAAPPAPAKAEPVALVKTAQAATVRSHNLRHSQKHRREGREDEDDREDDRDGDDYDDDERDERDDRGSVVEEAVTRRDDDDDEDDRDGED